MARLISDFNVHCTTWLAKNKTKQNKNKKKLRKSTNLYDWYFIDFFACFFFTEYFIPTFK